MRVSCVRGKSVAEVRRIIDTREKSEAWMMAARLRGSDDGKTERLGYTFSRIFYFPVSVSFSRGSF